jgi:thioredoxin 2
MDADRHSTRHHAQGDGTIVPCPSCGQKNRMLYARLDRPARCGACGAALLAPGAPIAADGGGELAAILAKASLPVLVDFWAPWCGPCRSMAPEVEKLAASEGGRLLVVKTNTDVDPAVGSTHRVASIPTLALFHHGREVARTSGARPAAAIAGFVRQALSAAAAAAGAGQGAAGSHSTHGSRGSQGSHDSDLANGARGTAA